MSARVTEADRRAAEAIWRTDGPWRMGSVGKLAQALADYREQATAELVEALEAAIATEATLIDYLSRAGRPQLASHFACHVEALPIATRNGRPAYENPPPRKRGDMAAWRADLERRRQEKVARGWGR